MVLAAQFQWRAGGEKVAGLLHAAIAGEDSAGQDQGLGAGAAFGESAVGEEEVGAVFGGHAGRKNVLF